MIGQGRPAPDDGGRHGVAPLELVHKALPGCVQKDAAHAAELLGAQKLREQRRMAAVGMRREQGEFKAQLERRVWGGGTSQQQSTDQALSAVSSDL